MVTDDKYRYKVGMSARRKQLTVLAVAAVVVMFLVFFVPFAINVLVESELQKGLATPEQVEQGTRQLFEHQESFSNPDPVPASCRKRGMTCAGAFRCVYDSMVVSYRRCLQKRLRMGELWQMLPHHVDHCLGSTLRHMLHTEPIYNQDDVKFMTYPSDMNAPCNAVTLGIGFDIKAEQHLKKRMPNCKFYGADPVREAGQMFRELGDYHPVAVASRSGKLDNTVIVHGELLDTVGSYYAKKTVDTLSITDFLSQTLKINKVDFLSMDNEGAEYNIFRQMAYDGPVIAANISICQISTELHAPLRDFNETDHSFLKLMEDMLARSPFLPITVHRNYYHLRGYLINAGDEYCIQKYFLRHNCGGA